MRTVQLCQAWIAAIAVGAAMYLVTVVVAFSPWAFAVYGRLFVHELHLPDANCTVRWLWTLAPRESLQRATISGAFTDVEMDHYVSVRRVVRACLGAATAVSLAGIYAFRRLDPRLRRFAAARFWVVTTGVSLFFAVFAWWDWSALFSGVHQLLFPGEQWRFSGNSLSIRLFPPELWLSVSAGVFSVPMLLSAGCRSWAVRGGRK